MTFGFVGCKNETQETSIDGNGFSAIDFNISSQGRQSDIHNQQILVAINENIFNDILLAIPSMSGQLLAPNFETNQAVVLLSTIGPCSSLEITDVSENNDTRLITVTKVTESDPGLCNPTINAFYELEYAIVEFKRSSLPVSVAFKSKNDY